MEAKLVKYLNDDAWTYYDSSTGEFRKLSHGYAIEISFLAHLSWHITTMESADWIYWYLKPHSTHLI